MKYLFLALAAGVFLMGCNSNMAKASKNTTTDESSENLKPKQIINVTEEQQLLKFIGPNNQTYILRTTDNFETAELSDQSGKTHRSKIGFIWPHRDNSCSNLINQANTGTGAH